jgi:hypothetical protein
MSPVNAGGHFMADRVGDVLVSGSHRRAGPAHDSHRCPLGNAEDQQHGGGRVAGVVKAAVGHQQEAAADLWKQQFDRHLARPTEPPHNTNVDQGQPARQAQRGRYRDIQHSNPNALPDRPYAPGRLQPQSSVVAIEQAASSHRTTSSNLIDNLIEQLTADSGSS